MLIVLFDNILAVDFISRHALIWSFQSTVDGYQELIGLDYSRVQIIFDIERIKKKKRRDLFWRLQQIEIGAKAAFDLMLHRERKKANAKQS